MEQATNELIKLFKQRLRYPIVTVYLFVLIIHNWDVLSVFVLSNTPIEKRVEYLNEHFSNPYFVRIWLPLIKAMLFFIGAPYIMFGLDWCIAFANKKRRSFRFKRELDNLDHDITKAEKEYIIAEEKNGRKNLDTLNDAIADLQHQLEQANDLARKEKEVNELTVARHEKAFNELKNEYDVISSNNSDLTFRLLDLQNLEPVCLEIVEELDGSIKTLFQSSTTNLLYSVLYELSIQEQLSFNELGKFLEQYRDILYDHNNFELFLSTIRNKGLIYFDDKGFAMLSKLGKLYIQVKNLQS